MALRQRYAVVSYGQAFGHAAFVEEAVAFRVEAMALEKNPEAHFPGVTGEHLACMAYVMEQAGLVVDVFRHFTQGAAVVAVKC